MELKAVLGNHTCYNFIYRKHNYFCFALHLHVHALAIPAAAITVNENPTQTSHQTSQPNSVNVSPTQFPLGIPSANVDTYASVLQTCTHIKSLNKFHAHLVTNGLYQNIILQTKLITKYAMFGRLGNARQVFDNICKPNAFLWNTMIREYARRGLGHEALRVYYQMREADTIPDNFTYSSVLKACAGISALQEGKQIHEDIVKSGFEFDVFVGNALVTMYIKCRFIDTARDVFDKLPERDVVSWNSMIAGYAQNGHGNEALALFNQMQFSEMKPNAVTMVSVLQACVHSAALQQGKSIHAYIVRVGFELDVFVGNSLLVMYVRYGSIDIARKLFDIMSERDVVSWNAMIAGYAQSGYANEALRLFRQIHLKGLTPDSFSIVSALQACTHLEDLQEGKWIHDYIIQCGFESNAFVINSLLAMYAKCGSVDISHHLFDMMPNRNVVSWNTMIAGYVHNGFADEALTLFHKMRLTQASPDCVTMESVLQACAHLGALQHGKWIHSYIIQNGYESDDFVGNSLIAMYARCGIQEVAQKLFNKMSEKSVVSWNAIIAAYTQNGQVNEALALFQEMQLTDMTPDSITMVSVIQACTHSADQRQGQCIHGYLFKNGYESSPFVGTAIIDMYAQQGSIGLACQSFNELPRKDAVSWNAMIAGYSQNGFANEALTVFNDMLQRNIMPDTTSMASVLRACALLAALQEGQCIHAYIIASGLMSNVFVGTALIDMHTKCGSLDSARQLFEKMTKRNVVSWNAMIAGYAQNGHANEALKLFHQMQSEDMTPDLFTMVSVLQACACLGALQYGKSVHKCIFQKGFDSDMFVGTALVDMYCKCGSVEVGRHLFDHMRDRNLVSWNAMIAGYAQNGYANDSLMVFHQMQSADIMPDVFTVVSVLQACAHLGDLQQGKWIHKYIVQTGFDLDVSVRTALIDMYCKCGCIKAAHYLFDTMLEKNASSWNAMISGYGMHGDGKSAIEIFLQMQQTGAMPNEITFISILSACSHAGLVDEGLQYFHCMIRDFGIEHKMQHYACMVDLLGRAGQLIEAYNFIENMPLEPDISVWGAFLGACRIHHNIELGKIVAERIFHLEPENAGYYVLLSNIYATSGKWDDVANIRAVMRDKDLKKTPGYSLIELNTRVYTFLTGGTTPSI